MGAEMSGGYMILIPYSISDWLLWAAENSWFVNLSSNLHSFQVYPDV